MSETDEIFWTNACNITLKALAKYTTCATFGYIFATFICNNCNITLKHLKHLTYICNIGKGKTRVNQFQSSGLDSWWAVVREHHQHQRRHASTTTTGTSSISLGSVGRATHAPGGSGRRNAQPKQRAKCRWGVRREKAVAASEVRRAASGLDGCPWPSIIVKLLIMTGPGTAVKLVYLLLLTCLEK
jgi:hypothetical protein